MPMYDYACSECGAEFDAICSIAERDDPQPCECGEIAKRVMSGGNFMLIGGGWSGGGFHPKIHPAKPDPNARTTPHDNYHNCTPESVREALHKQS